jgi:hypothetical protein
MVDPQNCYSHTVVVDLIDDPVGSAPGRPQTLQLTTKFVADPTGSFGQWSDNELHYRGSS